MLHNMGMCIYTIDLTVLTHSGAIKLWRMSLVDPQPSNIKRKITLLFFPYLCSVCMGQDN